MSVRDVSSFPISNNRSISDSEAISIPFDNKCEAESKKATSNRGLKRGIQPILNQLKKKLPGNLFVSDNFSHPVEVCNSIMLIINFLSDEDPSPDKELLRLVSRGMSIGVYLLGTAMFASVTLLSLKASLTVSGVLGLAAIVGRALAKYVVEVLDRDSPIIQVIAAEDEEDQIIAGVLQTCGQNLQVEIDGHVIVGGRRVTDCSRDYAPSEEIQAKSCDAEKDSGDCFERAQQKSQEQPTPTSETSLLGPFDEPQ